MEGGNSPNVVRAFSEDTVSDFPREFISRDDDRDGGQRSGQPHATRPRERRLWRLRTRVRQALRAPTEDIDLKPSSNAHGETNVMGVDPYWQTLPGLHSMAKSIRTTLRQGQWQTRLWLSSRPSRVPLNLLGFFTDQIHHPRASKTPGARTRSHGARERRLEIRCEQFHDLAIVLFSRTLPEIGFREF